jgi:subtilisin-like proprotein convertase family protein
VFGQAASSLVTAPVASGGTHQFTQSGNSSDLALCTYELCHLDESGRMRIEPVAAGSMSAIISQASQPDAEKYLVFYPVGQERNPNERRVLRTRYVVTLAEGADLNAIKTRCGMKSIELVREGSNLALCEEESAGRVLGQLNNVLNDPEVVSAEPIFAKKRFKRAIPTDPFYGPNESPDTNGNYQWYLNNEGINGGVPDIDINLEGALDRATGAGVTVAVIDDGFSTDHLDLAANAGGPHLNLLDGDPADPATLDTTATHGTGIAALIAASFNNAEGISGVAPGATLSGIRLLTGAAENAGLIDDADEARALRFSNDEIDVYNSSWGPDDTTLDLEGPGSLALTALQNGVENGRPVAGDAKGVIYVWSAGNGGGIGDRSDYDGYASSKYTIAVGAIDDSGRKSNYSEEGSNIVVVAPSSGGAQEVLTATFGLGVDDDDNPIRTTAYTTDFGGTSTSAALVSGVVALMLEEAPNLTWRDVQNILIRTAKKVDANDGDWIDNAAGLSFNHKYGAGLVDAAVAVDSASRTAAGTNPSLGAAERHQRSRFFSSLSNDPTVQSGEVPDNDGSSLLVGFDMTTDFEGNARPNLRVEHVELNATIITQSRTDLEIVLISPNGTQSILQAVDADNTEQSISRWTFMSVRNWGEGSAGTWVVRVTDRITGNAATLNNATLVINGSLDPEAPVSQVPLLTSSPLITVDQGAEFIYNLETSGAAGVTVGDLPNGVTFDPVTSVISGSALAAGLFSIPIILTDENGVEGRFNINIVVRPTAVALGDAVGLSGIPAVFGGDGSWDFELIDTNDGDAENPRSARSAVGLQDNETSVFGFDNLSQGVLYFDWKTSSEEGADRLWFNRGGDVPEIWDAFISGQREWTTTAIVLPDASNNVRWIYTKNGSESEGEDRGLVDNVRLVSMEKHMEDVIAAAAIEGFVPEFDSRMTFYPRPTAFASPAPGGTEPVALASPAVGNGQTASLSTWVEGPGDFSFIALVYGEPSDVFEMVMDGVVVITEPGVVGDSLNPSVVGISRAIPAGRHRIQLRYRKGFTGTGFSEFDDGDTDDIPFDGIVLDDIKFVSVLNYGGYASAFGSGFDPSPSADGDGDGYSNHQEYAFGGNVLVADIPKYLPKVVTSGSDNFIEYGVDTSRTDLEFVPQQSTDLSNWVGAELTTLDRVEGDVEIHRIPVLDGAGRGHLFYRVVARAK